MNERIKELVLEAGDYVNETYTGPVRSKTPGKIWEDGHVGCHTQFNEIHQWKQRYCWWCDLCFARIYQQSERCESWC